MGVRRGVALRGAWLLAWGGCEVRLFRRTKAATAAVGSAAALEPQCEPTAVATEKEEGESLTSPRMRPFRLHRRFRLYGAGAVVAAGVRRGRLCVVAEGGWCVDFELAF